MHFYLNQTACLHTGSESDKFVIISDDDTIGEAEFTKDNTIFCTFFDKKIRLVYAPKEYYDPKIPASRWKIAAVFSVLSKIFYVLLALLIFFCIPGIDLASFNFGIPLFLFCLIVMILERGRKYWLVPKPMRKRWFRFFQNEEQCGQIDDDYQCLNELLCTYQEKQYRLYRVGLGEDGMKFPIYEDIPGGERQVALIEKGTIIRKSLDTYEITAADTRAGLLAAIFTLCIDRRYYPVATDVYDGRRAGMPVDYLKWTFLSRDRNIIAKHDPTFKERVLGRDNI